MEQWQIDKEFWAAYRISESHGRSHNQSMESGNLAIRSLIDQSGLCVLCGSPTPGHYGICEYDRLT